MTKRKGHVKEAEWCIYLPEHCIPRDILQKRAMSIDGGEQRLSRTFSDRGPRINTQLTELGIQTHPLSVRGRYRFFVFGANTAAIISTFIGRSFSFFQRCANLFPVLRQKVGDVPLRDNFEQHRNHENVILIAPWVFLAKGK